MRGPSCSGKPALSFKVGCCEIEGVGRGEYLAGVGSSGNSGEESLFGVVVMRGGVEG